MFVPHKDIHSTFDECSAVLRLAYLYLVATVVSVQAISPRVVELAMESLNDSLRNLSTMVMGNVFPMIQDACDVDWRQQSLYLSSLLQRLKTSPAVSPLLGRYAALLGTSLLVWYVGTSLASWVRLRQFPAASWLANFSYLWLAKTTYSGRQYWVHRELHRKHQSPLVRIGPNELMTDDPDVIRRISAARSGYVRDTWYITGRFNPYHDNMFTVLEPKAHKQFKSRTLHAYSGRELPDFEAGIDEQVQTLVDTLRRKYAAPAAGNAAGKRRQGAPVDLGPISCYFTMDVITRLGFGHEFGYLQSETDLYNFLGGVRDLWPRMSTSADIPWIRNVLFSKFFLKLLGPGPKDKEGFGALMAVAEQHVGRRFQEGPDSKKDMLSSFIHHGLDQTECEVEGLFMVVAGTESTASAIRSVLVHTMSTPAVYSQLKAEIATAVRSGAASSPVIKNEEAVRLPVLQAVIYEGLRMRPPLLGLLPKVVPAGGDTLAGHHVPAGTAVCVNASSLLRSEALFGPDTDVFRPGRFLDLQDPEARAAMQRNVELAFGSGQWQCVGKTIAFMELHKVVFEANQDKLFRRFDMHLVRPLKPCDVLSYGVFLESNLMVRVTEAAQMETAQ
ncbi:Cytochrome P450 monooxygenase aba1 [Pyricularia oryzae]|uniref:Cytochrome P450 monooxygenase aba1 n=1 Tax=Pyricularia grisea TaxID=148305 RepID=A0ABQ8NGP3_PYRGI|nr:Cytochrome P450 monooxygenase aba1 [Pyricularia grisea]KAI6327984.1 Cytochrome P450 monooxygenase aba1 [Pyricularia oryzae]KAI6448513.1 Cytochrome P450 monooxygenase aba1 [Pyricularia oryzae]KAI6569126.1 Cytochrome P450 monooxygenase aba1 [Pyricularia oryzae]